MKLPTYRTATLTGYTIGTLTLLIWGLIPEPI